MLKYRNRQEAAWRRRRRAPGPGPPLCRAGDRTLPGGHLWRSGGIWPFEVSGGATFGAIARTNGSLAVASDVVAVRDVQFRLVAGSVAFTNLE